MHILLLHDIHDRTVDTLPILFEQLKARGLSVPQAFALCPSSFYP
jgi:hypothetical protein